VSDAEFGVWNKKHLHTPLWVILLPTFRDLQNGSIRFYHFIGSKDFLMILKKAFWLSVFQLKLKTSRNNKIGELW